MESRQACRLPRLNPSALPAWICSASERPERYQVLGLNAEGTLVKLASVARGIAFWTGADFLAEQLTRGGQTSCADCWRKPECNLVEAEAQC